MGSAIEPLIIDRLALRIWIYWGDRWTIATVCVTGVVDGNANVIRR